jgi:CRISPR system Cascade subunit CasB
MSTTDMQNKMAQAAGIVRKMKAGDRAEVRRGKPTRPLWEIIHHIHGLPVSPSVVETWQALGYPLATATFARSPRFGAALKQAGFSEARFARLLDADRETLPSLLRAAARQLASANQPANLEGARLLLAHPESREIRLRIAQDYYKPSSEGSTSDEEPTTNSNNQ